MRQIILFFIFSLAWLSTTGISHAQTEPMKWHYFVTHNGSDDILWAKAYSSQSTPIPIYQTPHTFDASPQTILPAEELMAIETFMMIAPDLLLTTPAIDLSEMIEWQSTIEMISVAPQSEQVAIVVKQSFCLLEYRQSESCFGSSKILIIAPNGQQQLVENIGLHMANKPYFEVCTFLVNFHRTDIQLLGWTFDANHLILKAEGSGGCFHPSENAPFIIVTVDASSPPVAIGGGDTIAISPTQNQFIILARDDCACRGYLNLASIDGETGQVDVKELLNLRDVVGGNLVWLSDTRFRAVLSLNQPLGAPYKTMFLFYDLNNSQFISIIWADIIW